MSAADKRAWELRQAKAELLLRQTADKAALGLVLEERAKQDARWGVQNHSPFIWLSILTEEVGEFSQTALETYFGGPKGGRMLEEAVQVAAVALAIVECLQREEWTWK